jgi:hypothetical protein
MINVPVGAGKSTKNAAATNKNYSKQRKIMSGENKRRHERVKVEAKVKLPGDTAWAECKNSDVSGSGLLFETGKELQSGDFVTLQFMLHTQSGVVANVHFFASAKVIRTKPKDNTFEIAVEFIIDESVRKEILKVVEIIKSQQLKVDRPTSIEAVLHKDKPQ